MRDIARAVADAYTARGLTGHPLLWERKMLELLAGLDRLLTEDDRVRAESLYEEALALLAAPKTRGRRAPAPPLKDLGTDPLTGRSVVIKDGRFGPYVTDGSTNATLPKSWEPDDLEVDQAVELLARAAKRKGRGRGRGKPARGRRRG